jgi:KTSC domain
VQRTRVISSHLGSVGYDYVSQTLEIQFRDGQIYQYFDVPLAVYRGLMEASSKGRYFASVIKGVYRFR